MNQREWKGTCSHFKGQHDKKEQKQSQFLASLASWRAEKKDKYCMLSTYESYFAYVGLISMRILKQVRAREVLQFCGLATIKSPTNTCGNIHEIEYKYEIEYKLHEWSNIAGNNNSDL